MTIKSNTTILIYIALIMFNYITAGQINNLILSIPQFIIVLLFIFKRDYQNALFFHFLFVVTSISAVRTMLNVPMFSYAGLKSIGLVGVNQIISVILYILIINKYRIKENHLLFHRFRNVIGYLGISATIIGIFGWMFSDYFPYFIMSNIVYMSFIYIHIDMLLRFADDNDFKKKVFYNVIYLLIATPIALCVCFNIFHIGTNYSALVVIMQSELSFFSIVLLIALLFFKNITWIIISLICLCINIILSGRGGEIMFFLFGVVVFLLLLYKKNLPSVFANRKKVMQMFSVIIAVVVISLIPIVNFSLLTQVKFKQVMSLLNIFMLHNNFSSINDIGSSPFVRIAQIINIGHNGLSSPFFLLFGHGYGGYFVDTLNLFSQIDLTVGAYSPEIVSIGHFPRAHGAIPSTLLYNGLIGLFLIVNIGIKYIYKMKNNFLAFGAIILFFYGLYFNVQLALTTVLILFASEYNIKSFD